MRLPFLLWRMESTNNLVRKGVMASQGRSPGTRLPQHHTPARAQQQLQPHKDSLVPSSSLTTLC